jgi:branched-chain amino acid transport system substrate-binding protein
MAMRGDIQRAGIPQISMAGGTVITDTFDPLVFQTPWSNRIVVPFVLKAMQAAGVKKVAVLSDSGGYGKDGLAVIKEEAPKAGLAIVASETFNPGDTDLSTQLTKIKSSDADSILLWTAGKEAALAVKGARDLGIELPLYGGSGQARKEFGAAAGAASDRFVFGTGRSLIASNWASDPEELKVVSDFATRYEAAYGEQPDIFAGHAFDALNILVDGLKRAGADGDLRDAIEATNGLVGFGGRYSFTPTNHNGLTEKDLALYRFEGGAWQPFE